MSRSRTILRLGGAALLLSTADPTAAEDRSPHREQARALLAELVEIDTRVEQDGTAAAAAAMARHLRAAVPLPAYLDDVDARRGDCSFDPFLFREKNGHLHGRDERVGVPQFFDGREFPCRLVGGSAS